MASPDKRDLVYMTKVKDQSKGWPVGIPLPEKTARRLVAAGWCEWAPPMWKYPRPVFAVRLTTNGKVALDMAHPDYPQNMGRVSG